MSGTDDIDRIINILYGVFITIMVVMIILWGSLLFFQNECYRDQISRLETIQYQMINLRKMRGPIYIDPDVNAILIKLPQNGITFTIDPNMVEKDPEIADRRK